jgi:hypothetical protein
MDHEERKDDCDCPICQLRKMIESLLATGTVPVVLPPGSREGRWMHYQQSVAMLRGHASMKGKEKTTGVAKMLGLGDSYEDSTLGPLTGYQVMARQAKDTPGLAKVKDEMRMIALLISSLLSLLLEEARPLAADPNVKESRWDFYDRVAFFDALLMIRTVMLDMSGSDVNDLIFSNLDEVEEMGKLLVRCEKRTSN